MMEEALLGNFILSTNEI